MHFTTCSARPLSAKYGLKLCWANDEGGDTCTCSSNGFEEIKKLGRNSLGPSTEGRQDSDECHKLADVTFSRLVDSTDADDHLDCGNQDGSAVALGVAALAALVGLQL